MTEALNRNLEPALSDIKKPALLQAKKLNLSNGVPVYVLDAGTQEILKIDFIFRAGTRYETKPLQASFTVSMLAEGTKKRTASEIADEIDSYGGFFQTEAEKDNTSITLYTLSRYLDNTVNVVADVITSAAFPEEEFELYRKNARQRFLVNSERLDFIAKKNFHELLFGQNHPYGRNVSIDDYDKIALSDLKEYYNSRYSISNCYILVAGKAPSNLIEVLEKHIGNISPAIIPSHSATHRLSFTKDEKFIEKKDALQSVIMIGTPTINRTHPDFPALQVANAVLGGYFGSRLMSNIREDKGYTYGIGSGLASLADSGYFYITTEVGADVCSNAVKEIYYELDKLGTELVPETELDLVKKYLYGVFLRSIDGPFSLAEKLKVVIDSGLGMDYYDRYLSELKTITPERILELYNMYLRKDLMTQLVVGKI